MGPDGPGHDPEAQQHKTENDALIEKLLERIGCRDQAEKRTFLLSAVLPFPLSRYMIPRAKAIAKEA